MCGIVGYVGPNVDGRALDVVMEGLRPAGVPRVRLGRRGAGRRHPRRHPQAGRQAGQPHRGDRRRADAAAPAPASGTPAGPPTAAPPTPTPTPTAAARTASWRSSTTASSRTSTRSSPACRPTGWTFLSETDTEVVAHLLARAYDTAGDLTEAMRQVVQRPRRGLHAAGRARRPARRGRRRPPQQPAGRRPRRGRELPGVRRRRLHRAHPRGDRARPGPDRDDHHRGRHRHRLRRHARPRASTTTSTGTPPPPRRAATDTFMEKEIHDQPHAVADTLLGRTDESGRLVLDELRISEEDLRSVDKIVIVACGTAAYAGMVAKYAIEHWCPDPVRGRAGARVPLPRPGGRRAHPGGLDLPVRGDDGHPDGGQARPRAGRPDHRHLQHPRLDHPARVRRRPLHPRRPRDRGRLHQGVPGPDHRLLHPRSLPRPAARRHLRRRGPGRA